MDVIKASSVKAIHIHGDMTKTDSATESLDKSQLNNKKLQFPL